MASITATPASPTHAKDNVILTVAGQAANDAALNDPTKYPTEPEIVAYFQMVAPAGHTPQNDMTTVHFSTNAAGGESALPVIFPIAGTWTINLIRVSDGSTLATASLVVA